MIRDTLILFRRSMTNTLRNPVWVILGLFQPVLYLLLFAPLLDNLAGPGISSGAAFNLFTPGLLVLTALYSAAFVGFSVIAVVGPPVVTLLCVEMGETGWLVLAAMMLVIAAVSVPASRWALASRERYGVVTHSG